MKRRSFLSSLPIAASIIPISDALSLKQLFSQNHLQIFTQENDKRVKDLLSRQETRKDHPFYGGWANRYGLYNTGTPASYSSYLMAAYLSKESQYYKSEAVENALELAIDFLLDKQHEDGNIDLLITNFHSPPDLGFAVEPLSLALTNLRKYLPKALPSFQQKAATFLKAAGEAMRIGGIHTPNHRWVVCRALARVDSLFPNQGLVDRIEEWLNEGIDIDPDGQYTEKSVVVYSPITNQSLITVARLLNKPGLYVPVRKNLEMTQYFLHANGELVTEASRRQDQFTIAKINRSYYDYLYMALLDDNPRFGAMVKHIEQSIGLEKLSTILPYVLEDERLMGSVNSNAKLPTNYAKHFPHSDMVRIRRENYDATILANNHIFFTFFKGNAALQAIRFASAFFGKAQFTSPSLRIEDGKYVLEQELYGPYYQPFPKDQLPEDGDWHKMPRYLRPQSEVQHIKSRVEIVEIEGGFELAIEITGTDHVPLAIELAFRSGGTFKGVEQDPNVEAAYLLKEAKGTYTFEGDTIEFGPGQAPHVYTQVRGAKPKLNGDSVYVTGYTPFKYRLFVK